MNNVKSFTKNIKEYKITRIKNLQKKKTENFRPRPRGKSVIRKTLFEYMIQKFFIKISFG